MSESDALCDCPGFAKPRWGVHLVNHTYACLLQRRGDRTLVEYYGQPAIREPEVGGRK